MSSPRDATTEDVDLPFGSDPQTPCPVMLVLYPVPAVLPMPELGVPFGRDWLIDHGAGDGGVSRKHLVFTRPGGNLFVNDAGSHNGTWVNGRLLDEGAGARMLDGTLVRVGQTILMFRENLAGEQRPLPPLGGLVAPFGLRRVRGAIAGIRKLQPKNVLIRGETGTGKELVAQEVARALGRDDLYTQVNITAIPENVFDSHLFGHGRGAFTGATQAEPGLIKAHDGGAIFFDEIGDLPMALQTKLLRFIEYRQLWPIGATRPTTADVTVIAGTNKKLDEAMKRGEFREDLLARFSETRFDLDPVRNRVEDIFEICRAVEAAKGRRLDAATMPPHALELLLMLPWPDNVRGLARTLHEVTALLMEAEAEDEGYPYWAVAEVLGMRPTEPLPGRLTVPNVQAALEKTGGNKKQAAVLLDVSRGLLLRFMKESGMVPANG